MRTTDFDYQLPQHLIAQSPVEPRDHSRLMVLRRSTGQLTHRPSFTDLEKELRPGDLLVFNDSRVIPARLYGVRTDTGIPIEVLLLNRIENLVWSCLGRPARKLQPKTPLTIIGNGVTLTATVEEIFEEGIRIIRFHDEELLYRAGEMPLPPYIHTRLKDQERYQTVYSRLKGSVAAPTAGLHFTHELLERLRDQGVKQTFVTLHVGLDTFRPVHEKDPREHKMHSEYWTLSEEAAEEINLAKATGQRVIAVGTTSVRLLEQAALLATGKGNTVVQPGSGWTDLFVLHGHEFRAVDAMLTNFHLPRSTLLMLVSAFAGRESVLHSYSEAIELGYRFYSFGDCMAIF